ncbi:MAG TPA: ROK family protein [Eoetvoesiella sp.]
MKPGILTVDIGGTSLKAAVINSKGRLLADAVYRPTPQPCGPALLVDLVSNMVGPLPAYDRISIGFPGVVKGRRVMTAPHLYAAEWKNFALADALAAQLGHPAKIANDADMQGFALVSGQGLELAVTLGTGVGTALYRDGELMPHMELSQHPIYDGKTYDEYLGAEAFEQIGAAGWNKRLRKALDLLHILLNPDQIFVGGGNAIKIDLDLSKDVIIGPKEAGLKGGFGLWRTKL